MREVNYMTQVLHMNIEKENKMKILCFSFSNKGALLGTKLEGLYSNVYDIKHINNKEVDGGIKSILEESFKNADGLIFISATGIAIRYISKFVKDKKMDPAILVIDDMGKFVISLLSGHLGGANELSNKIARDISAIPVITTATDGRGIEAIDMYSKRKNYHMLDMTSVKDVTAAMVNGEKIAIYSDYKEDINYNNFTLIDSLDNIDNDIRALVIVSNKKIDLSLDIPYTVLVPKDINIGIGCKRGVETSRIISAIYEVLDRENIYVESLRKMGTVEVKKDEVGILEAKDILNIPLEIFTIEELKKVESIFEGSEFVRKTIGVSCVSEPSAYLLGEKMIVLKSVHNGITISISQGGSYE